MTSFDDLTDSSPESPAEQLAEQPTGPAQTAAEAGTGDVSVEPSDDPGGEGDLGSRNADAVSGPDAGSDAERGNLDGSTPHEESWADALDESRQAVRDPSEAGPEQSDLGSDIDYDPQSADAGDSGQDNGRTG